jgi:perosamine synthetase
MLRLSVPHLDDDAITAATAVLRSGNLVYGAEGAAFEAELATYLGTRNALVVSSGTAALHLALVALEVGPGDAVLVPDFTFPATGNVVRLVGAKPVLVDVDPANYCLTPASLEAAIAEFRGPERLRAVMPVHEFGHPVAMDDIVALANRHQIAVVEDAACAIGATLDGQKLGTFGAIGCYSLHPRKTLTTGEGGVLVTNDDVLARRLRRLRNHGMERDAGGLCFIEAGWNLRLTDIQSAIGRVQLPRLDSWISQRRALAKAYFESLGPLVNAGLIALPSNAAGHSWQTFMTVLADGIDRRAVIQTLLTQGIEVNLGAQCLSALPPFEGCGGGPVALRLFKQGLAVPFCEQYGFSEVSRVTAALNAALD